MNRYSNRTTRTTRSGRTSGVRRPTVSSRRSNVERPTVTRPTVTRPTVTRTSPVTQGRPTVDRSLLRKEREVAMRERKLNHAEKAKSREEASRKERVLESRARRASEGVRQVNRKVENFEKELRVKEFEQMRGEKTKRFTDLGFKENDVRHATNISRFMQNKYGVDEEKAIKMSKQLLDDIDRQAGEAGVSPKASNSKRDVTRMGISAKNIETPTNTQNTEEQEVISGAESLGVKFDK